MKTARVAASILFALLCALAAAVPKTLIVQISANPKEDASPLALGDGLARALEDTGKMDTIVWSMSDPIFRAAVLDGRLTTTPDRPSLEQILEAAKKLQCDYAMAIKAGLKGTEVSGKLEVYRGGRMIWSDSEAMDPGRSSILDMGNAVRSISRTWSFKMAQSILKDIQVEPKPPETPAPAAGQIAASPAATSLRPQKPEDSSRILAEYQQKVAANHAAEALLYLRDAIDAHPLDAALRKAYIKHLQQDGKDEEAAAEAKRASALILEDQELRALAAKAFLHSGKGEDAMAELNEALARNPQDPVARAMAADLAMQGQRFAEALSHLDVVLKIAPSRPLFYRRAMVYGILGNGQAAQADLAQAASLPQEAAGAEDWDLFCCSILDAALDQTSGDLRSLAQRLAVRREDSDAQSELDAQIQLLKSRTEFAAAWPTTGLHKKSGLRRSLALSLLAQSLSGFKAFVTDGNEDTLTDANIDLGEAIKQLKSAREALSAEGKRTEIGSTTLHLDH